MLPIRPRTILLLVLLWLGISGAVFVVVRSHNEYVAAAERAELESDKKLWDIVHELADDSLVGAVADYTFWNDMAEFAEGTRDIQWAYENLNPGLESFGIDALWVLSAEGDVVYSVMKSDGATATPPPLPLDRTALERLIATRDEEYGPMHEFYWFSDMGPMTVVGSDITSTEDADHLLPSRGYYFAARLLTTESALSHLAEIGATFTVERLSESPPDSERATTGEHTYSHRMWDHTGATIGTIRITHRNEALDETVDNSVSAMHMSVALWVLTGVLTSGLLFALGQTQQRAEGLARQMTEQLRKANDSLEQRVAERTAALEEDIAQRTAAEEGLKKRTEELERMNRVMIDRELRVVELKRKLKETAGGSAT